MQKEKTKMIIWFLIVIVVVLVLVFITLNNKNEPPTLQTGDNTEVNMQNTKQIEGVKITTLKEGTGEEAKNGDKVDVNYTGKLLDGTVFDSNIDPKFGHVEPFQFTLGSGQVIQGWDIGVAGMKVGEKRELEIASDYAYGPNGVGPIPPNSTLVFEVELLKIIK